MNSAPTCLAVTPEDPSAPMITVAVTAVPSASRAVAPPVGLVDRADLCPLPDDRAALLGPANESRVELVAHHHGEQRLGMGAGELAAAAERECHRRDLVPDGQRDLAGHGGAGDADQAAAARLVARMLGPLEHDGPRPRGGGGTRGGQAGRPAANDGNIPLSTFCHGKSLWVPSPRCHRAAAAPGWAMSALRGGQKI